MAGRVPLDSGLVVTIIITDLFYTSTAAGKPLFTLMLNFLDGGVVNLSAEAGVEVHDQYSLEGYAATLPRADQEVLVDSIKALAPDFERSFDMPELSQVPSDMPFTHSSKKDKEAAEDEEAEDLAKGSKAGKAAKAGKTTKTKATKTAKADKTSKAPKTPKATKTAKPAKPASNPKGTKGKKG